MGTAAVMLAAAFGLFVFMGAVVGFGSWPVGTGHDRVDELVVRAAAPAAERVTVGPAPRTRPARGSTPARRAARSGTRPPAPRPPAAPSPPRTAPRAPAPAPRPGPAPAPRPDGGGGGGDDPVARLRADLDREARARVEAVTDQVGTVVREVEDRLAPLAAVAPQP